MYCRSKTYNIAFTLAEVLITLGIIGVVAALTLPNLIANYKEKVLITAAKKSYSTIVNAINRWNIDNGIVGEYLTFFSSGKNDVERVNLISKSLNVVKICNSASNMSGCGGQYEVKQYKKMNNGHNQTQTAGFLNSRRVVLADGSFINLQGEATNGSCDHTYFAHELDSDGNFIPDDTGDSPDGFKGSYKSTDTCGFIYVDTNGLKGPNVIGKDVFAIRFTLNSIDVSGNSYGNLKYVLANDKLIKTEDYEVGEFKKD